MSEWPDNFDLRETPEIGTPVHTFITSEMEKLKVYGAQRPSGSKYIFHEHAERVAQNIKKTCLHMELGDLVAENMYWATLPHDIGKRKLPAEIWDKVEKPSDELKRQRRSHTDLGSKIVKEELGYLTHPFIDLTLDIMRNHHEQMNGAGYHGLTEEQLSKPVRLAAIVEAYDGWRIWRPHYGDRDISIPGVLTRMREEKGPDIFDMELFEAFAEMKMNAYNSGLDE
ncbi:MAG: hypothetical protein DHS20C02_03020 [Micavibrio sp.]|nr:MAG: hypothetical protein DHS20C02_03020 [Micavibrio sp.]